MYMYCSLNDQVKSSMVLGPAVQEKARLPYVDSQHLGTSRSLRVAECSWQRPSMLRVCQHSSDKYGGAIRADLEVFQRKSLGIMIFYRPDAFLNTGRAIALAKQS